MYIAGVLYHPEGARVIEEEGWVVEEDKKGSSAEAQGLPPWQLPDTVAARAEWEAVPGHKPWLNLDVEEIPEW